MNASPIDLSRGLPARAARAGVLMASLLAAGLAAYFLLAFLVFVGAAVYSKVGLDQGVWYERPTHLAMHLRAQTLAVTGLARHPGAWSTYVDRTGAQVLAKGAATRVVPRPTGMDLPVTPSMLGVMLDSNILVNAAGEGAVIRVSNADADCRAIFTKGNLSRFLEGPIEYRVGDAGEWKPYGKDFACPDKGYGHLWLRPVQADATRGGG